MFNQERIKKYEKDVKACTKIAPVTTSISANNASKSLFGIISSNNSLLFNGSTKLDNLLITIRTKPTETIPLLGQINSLNA